VGNSPASSVQNHRMKIRRVVAIGEKRVGSQAIGDKEHESVCCWFKGWLEYFDAVQDWRIEINVENRSKEKKMNHYAANN